MPEHRAVLAMITRTLAALLALGGLNTAASPASSTLGPTRTSSTEDGQSTRTANRVQRRLERLLSDTGLPGAIATVRDADGRERTYVAGSAKLGTDRAIDPRSRVRIASNTKMFTATVVLQLVAEGVVELDAPVERYLPKLVRSSGNDGRKITVRQLLQQRSGLPDYDSLVVEAGGSLSAVSHTYFEPHDLLGAALAEGRHFKPGTRWEYSNSNYVLLGLLVQRVTGRPISEEITRRVIRPLDLDDTYWPGVGEQRIRGIHPHGYMADAADEPWSESTRIDPSMGWAAGQLISSPSDLGHFMAALFDGRLLDKGLLAEMKRGVRAPEFDAEAGWRYGLGLASRTIECGVRGWGHGGDIQGFSTRNLVTDDGRWAVVTVTALPTRLMTVAELNDVVADLLCAS